MTTDGPDYVVIRAGAGLPDGFLPPSHDGRWYDRSRFPVRDTSDRPGSGVTEDGITYSEAVATPTGRFEVRDDGAVAEVWELRV